MHPSHCLSVFTFIVWLFVCTFDIDRTGILEDQDDSTMSSEPVQYLLIIFFHFITFTFIMIIPKIKYFLFSNFVHLQLCESLPSKLLGLDEGEEGVRDSDCTCNKSDGLWFHISCKFSDHSCFWLIVLSPPKDNKMLQGLGRPKRKSGSLTELGHASLPLKKQRPECRLQHSNCSQQLFPLQWEWNKMCIWYHKTGISY